ncbi:MAG TPA: pectinesterase family protein, partial [Verrucomicrobiae bacterium]|nr:pectinesterase family protein [Verrucomicrobiae bacterium]
MKTALLLGLLLATATAPAATVTWDASGTTPAAPTDGSGNWTTVNANWSNGSTDGAWTNGNSAIFGSGGNGGTVAVGSGVVVGNLTIATNYAFSSNNLTFTNNPTVLVTGASTTTTIGNGLAGSGFIKDGPGTLILNQSANNTYTGDTIINNGILQPGSTGGRFYIPGNLVVNSNGTFVAVSGGPGSGVFGGGVLVLNGQSPRGSNVWVNSGAWITASTAVLANGAVITNAGGGTSGTYAVTNTDARSGAVWLTRHGFGVVNTIAKSTAGAVVIASRPNSSGTDGFIATLNAGALVFDYAYAANAAVKIKAGSQLTFQGGLLVFSNGSSALAPSANSPGSTVFNSGASSLFVTNAGTGGNVAFGTLTRKAGATFNLVKNVGTGNIGSSGTANVNGIVGGWNTFNLTDWSAGTGTWAALAAGSYTVSVDPTTWVAANNVSLAANNSPNVPDLKVINSLRLTAASTVTLTGSLTLSSGGLLVTGSGATAITGGTLLGASGQDLIVHQNASADLTVSSILADNGTATSLTKDGTGKLIITGVNNMTGTNYFNGGTVEVSDLSKLASGPLDMNGGTLHYTGSSVGSARLLTTRGLGPILDITGGTTVTQTGTIIGSGDVLGDFGGLTKNGNGTLVLTASNSYNGETVLNSGGLTINGTNNCNFAVWDAGKVTVYGGTLSGLGVITGPVTAKVGGTISPGNGSLGTLTLATNLSLESGSTNLFAVTNGVAGDLLAVQGNLSIQPNCTIAINLSGSTLQVGANTLITYAGTKTGSFNPTVVVNGGSFNGSLTIDETTPGQIRLVVIPQVAITSQPSNVIASTNDLVTFSVGATGSAPLNYQWYYYGSNTNSAPTALTGATGSSYSIGSADSSNSGYYAVVVSNSFNSVISRFALLVVGNVAAVLSGPANLTVVAGNNASFNTTIVLANPPPTLQWQTNGVNVAGATTTSLTLNNVPFALDGTIVSVIASNAAGSVTNSATLNVIVTPAISPQPVAVTTNAGSTVVFTTGVTGFPTPGLQWYKNNIGLAGQTGSTLTLVNVQGTDVGSYKLVATNAAGTATSSSVKLTVLSTALATTAFTPASGATGVGYDTPLYITFNNPLSIINSGKVRIYNANNTVTPVDTIDMSSNSVVVSTLNATLGIFLTNNIQPHSTFSGDSTAFNYFPVIITNNIAAIYPHAGVLTSNQTYIVTLDPGVVGEPGGAYFAGISDTNAWRFTTKVAGPLNVSNIVVAADGSGDFVTVQGAVDSIPVGGYAHTLINVRNGNYVEIVNVSGKTNITFRGQSRLGTVIGYGNNNNLNPSTANRMAFKVNANDIAVENMTLVNRTPQGGSQAETIMVNTSAARFILNNADVNSLQDTILANVNSSQGYFYNSTVRGNFDFIWGGGNLFFTNCLIYTVPNIYVTNNYNLTASRTDTGTGSSSGNWAAPSGVNQFTKNGISYVGCRLAADPAVATVTLEGANGSVNGLASWINCDIDTNHYVTPISSILSTYILWEYGNSNVDNSAAVSLGLTVLPPSDP